MASIEHVHIDNLYEDMEEAQSVKIRVEKRIDVLEKQIREHRWTLRGATAIIDAVTSELNRRMEVKS